MYVSNSFKKYDEYKALKIFVVDSQKISDA